MTLKEARKACRERCAEFHLGWNPLGWNKHNGYYAQCDKDQYTICFVDKSGVFMYASKENERKHNLKGNVPWIGVDGKRKGV